MVANLALELVPEFEVTHFTIANIHTSIVSISPDAIVFSIFSGAFPFILFILLSLTIYGRAIPTCVADFCSLFVIICNI